MEIIDAFINGINRGVDGIRRVARDVTGESLLETALPGATAEQRRVLLNQLVEGRLMELQGGVGAVIGHGAELVSGFSGLTILLNRPDIARGIFHGVTDLITRVPALEIVAQEAAGFVTNSGPLELGLIALSGVTLGHLAARNAESWARYGRQRRDKLVDRLNQAIIGQAQGP